MLFLMLNGVGGDQVFIHLCLGRAPVEQGSGFSVQSLEIFRAPMSFAYNLADQSLENAKPGSN